MFFFFQAEDGIRDDLVTGVQTCALPISPERSAREQEERHAEHVIRGGLRLTALVSLAALPGQIFEIVPVGQANIRNQSSHGFRLIGFEFAKKEFLEGCAAKVEQSSLGLGE